MSDNDSQSVSSMHSAGSVSFKIEECLYCKKELQVRSLFSHIYKYHLDDFLKTCFLQPIENAVAGKPLKLQWTVKDDFDEERLINIFGCLATFKTFTTQEKAIFHLTDKKRLSEHKKAAKELLKNKKKYMKDVQKRRNKDPLMAAIANKDPKLVQAYWTGLMHHKKVCEIALNICDERKYNKQTDMFLIQMKSDGSHNFKKVSYDEFMAYDKDLMNRVQTMYESKCKDLRKLGDLYCELWRHWRDSYCESIPYFNSTMQSIFPEYDTISDDNPDNFAVCSDKMERVFM